MSNIPDDLSIYRVQALSNAYDKEKDSQKNRQEAEEEFKNDENELKNKRVSGAALLEIKKIMQELFETKDESLSQKLHQHKTCELPDSAGLDSAKDILHEKK